MYNYTELKMGEYVLTLNEEKISPAMQYIGNRNKIITPTYTEPSEIVHYCPVNAFKNIIITNLFWMNNLNNVNDKREGKWFIEFANKIITSEFHSDISKEDLILLMLLININLKNAYATCFRTLKDNFEKWKIYGDNNTGIAIIINPKVLSITRGLPIRSPFATSEESCALIEINYDIEEQEKIIKNSINMLNKSRSNIHNIATYIAKLAYTCKRNNFVTENEWRILFTPLEYWSGYKINNTESFSICNYFINNNKKYYGFYLPKDMISEIIIGSNAQITKDEIYKLLSKNNHNIDKIKVYKSEI